MFDIVCAFIIGAIFGYISKTGNPTLNVELYSQVEKLKEEIAYYKDLCKWHVEEKAKLQRIKDQFESECG
jgi:hypothetical protein